MKRKRNKKKQHRSTDLSKHKRSGSLLLPPFRQMGNIRNSSWKDERLPEMLWAVVLIGNLHREEALNIFRKVGSFVGGNADLFDVTHVGIASWPKDKRSDFINLLKSSHPRAQELLQSLVIFHDIPAHSDWEEVMGNPKDEANVADYLANGVRATLDHQSEEATDCRWIKFLCEIQSGKLSFSSSMPDIRETLKGVLEYPNYGDLRHIRPFIRSSEIASVMRSVQSSEWPEKFWRACLISTVCAPLPRSDQRKDSLQINHEQISRIRHLLLLHYMQSDKSSSIEPEQDSIFGIGFYALRLLDEVVVTNLSRGAIGRLALRTFVEAQITLAYLIMKNDHALWEAFRNYGIGQMKLSYLKARDSVEKPAFIDETFLQQMANEDRWEEFSDIELSNWAKSDLRTMSEEAEQKELYDAYYSWTSNFSHGTWGAIRESNFTICANPLHRLHLIPSVIMYPLPGILEDAVKITNLILELIESQYPDFSHRITNKPKLKKTIWYKRLYNRFRYRKEQTIFDFITLGRTKTK